MDPMGQPASATEHRWTVALCAAGHPRDAVAHRLAALRSFCSESGTTPDDPVEQWQQYPALTVRRRRRGTEAANLAVESLLIYNGVNVFGDIVCVAGRPEDLALQGPQFVPRATGPAR